jgi:hypothetical protein
MDNSNAPAFPNITPEMCIQGGPGLSRRELLAALNFQGLCANSKEYDSAAHMAKLAVTGADALLAELAKDAP